MDLDEGGLRNLAQLWQNCALKMMLQHTHDVILVQNEVPSVVTRVVYDRVRKRKNYFEIPAFLQIEQGKSRAGKFKTSNENKNKNVFVFVFI